MLYQSLNPYNVLSQSISFDNLQQIGELITLRAVRVQSAYSKYSLHWLYVALVQDLNRNNDAHHVFSDAYDIVQETIYFLCDFIGKKLDDVYTVKNGKPITIRKGAYLLVGKLMQRIYKHRFRAQNIDLFTETLSVEIDSYQEQDYTVVDKKIELLNLKPRDQLVLDCYMGGMTCNEIAEFLDIDRVTVWRRRQRAQVKYKSLFN
jgi:DNA-directed RNA polymerase specialized sigma24 family protein